MTKIRSAVIGAGYLGKFHAEKYASLECTELVGVVDADCETARALAARLHTASFTDYRELIGKVDAVSIVTPTNTHFDICMDFLKNGVDVLLEKPMTVTPEEAGLLIEASEKSGTILQVGHLERFNAAVVALEGKLSKPMFIEAHRLSSFPNRGTDVDVVLDLMIHDIDIILNLVKSEVESVDASGVPIISDKVDIANARLTFANGCVANVTASRVSLEPQRRIRLFQPDAYIAIDYAKQHISIYKRGEPADPPDKIVSGPPNISIEDLDIVKKDVLFEEIKHFLDCSRTRNKPLVTGYDGRRALVVAQRIQESVRKSMERITNHIEGVTV